MSTLADANQTIKEAGEADSEEINKDKTSGKDGITSENKNQKVEGEDNNNIEENEKGEKEISKNDDAQQVQQLQYTPIDIRL